MKIIAAAVILGLVFVLVLPMFREVYIRTNDSKVLPQLRTIERALEEYKCHFGHYPQQRKPMPLTTDFLDASHKLEDYFEVFGQETV